MPANFEPKQLKPKLDIVEKPEIECSDRILYASITVNVYEFGKPSTFVHTRGNVTRIREYIQPWNWGGGLEVEIVVSKT